jgi:hypothetical protein
MSNYLNSDGSGLVGALNPSTVGQALQVDAQGNLKVTTGAGNVVTTTRAATTILNQASAAQTANGNSADLTVGGYTELAVDANITAVAGTNPTLQLFLDRKGADNVYYPIWQSITVTAATQISTSIGPGLSIAQSFGSTIRLRWIISGSSGQSFTFSISIIAK